MLFLVSLSAIMRIQHDIAIKLILITVVFNLCLHLIPEIPLLSRSNSTEVKESKIQLTACSDIPVVRLWISDIL